VRWILLDIALILLSVGVLAILLLRLWRRVQALMRTAGMLTGAIGAIALLVSAVNPPFTGSSPARQTRAPRGA
jgi:predicted dinucleotide-utilizing enzyme